ncbi:hypothetical protein DPMN_094441 [Dreissena polymorpha]|uniref:Uncharacterized protein n=1 Tax=Dreissena polymorpha TaxID=45954 RepID=A0A9D4R1Y7_DREPO|nr:hypothetical protein DPMN_094441 [Dreissena polymorpha]
MLEGGQHNAVRRIEWTSLLMDKLLSAAHSRPDSRRISLSASLTPRPPNCQTGQGIDADNDDFRGVLSEIPVNSALFFLNDWSFYEYILLTTLGVI